VLVLTTRTENAKPGSAEPAKKPSYTEAPSRAQGAAAHWPNDQCQSGYPATRLSAVSSNKYIWGYTNLINKNKMDYDSNEEDDYSMSDFRCDYCTAPEVCWLDEDEYDDMVWSIETHEEVYSATHGRTIPSFSLVQPLWLVPFEYKRKYFILCKVQKSRNYFFQTTRSESKVFDHNVALNNPRVHLR
jgi:hypothetical protein